MERPTNNLEDDVFNQMRSEMQLLIIERKELISKVRNLRKLINVEEKKNGVLSAESLRLRQELIPLELKREELHTRLGKLRGK